MYVCMYDALPVMYVCMYRHVDHLLDIRAHLPEGAEYERLEVLSPEQALQRSPCCLCRAKVLKVLLPHVCDICPSDLPLKCVYRCRPLLVIPDVRSHVLHCPTMNDLDLRKLVHPAGYFPHDIPV